MTEAGEMVDALNLAEQMQAISEKMVLEAPRLTSAKAAAEWYLTAQKQETYAWAKIIAVHDARIRAEAAQESEAEWYRAIEIGMIEQEKLDDYKHAQEIAALKVLVDGAKPIIELSNCELHSLQWKREWLAAAHALLAERGTK
jgi:hypothetical protein